MNSWEGNDRKHNLFWGMEKAKQMLGLCWDLCLDKVPRCMPTILSERIILSQINGIYDPLGLAKPFMMKAKLLRRQLLSLDRRNLD